MGHESFDQAARLVPRYGSVLLGLPGWLKEQAFDIHIKAGQPIALCGREGTYFLNGEGHPVPEAQGAPCVSREVLREMFLQLCGHSVFRHEEEIRQGFVCPGGNCRVGLCGTAVVEGGRVQSVGEITSLVFRISREIPGCADRLFREGIPWERGLLVAGPPSSGKTTFLRDVARALATGRFGPVRRVAVLDERGELGSGDLGPCADVLRGYPKGEALDVAVRMLSPEFVLCDELSPKDLPAVGEALASGAAFIASVHAGPEELFTRPLCRALLGTGAFATAVCLRGREEPGAVERILRLDQEGKGRACEAFGSAAGGGGRAGSGPVGSGPFAPPGPTVA